MATVTKEPGCLTRLFSFEVPMHPILRIALTIIVPIITGPCHLNWPTYQSFFMTSGHYQDLCIEDTEVVKVGDMASCKGQQAAIQRVFTTIMAFQFGFSLLGGFTADKLVPKMAATAGFLLRIVGYSLLSISTSAMPLYLLGAACIGLGQDMSYFPLFSLTNYYPDKKGTILALLGMARSVAFIVPKLLSFMSPALSARAIVGCGHCVFSFVSIGIVMLTLPDKNMATQATCTDGTDLDKGPQAEKSVKDQFKEICGHIGQPKFIVLLPLAIGTIMRPSFLGSITKFLLPNTCDVFTVVGTFSFLPCPLIGMFIDRFSVFPIMQFINACGSISVIAAIMSVKLGGSVFWEWVFIISHNGAMSFLVSQIYCYIATQYPADVVGRLVGVTCAFIGVGIALCSPLYQLSQDIGLVPILTFFVGFSAVMGLAAGYLWIAAIQSRRKALLK